MTGRRGPGGWSPIAWAGLLARLIVGGIWIWAGLLKLPHPEESVTAVRAYQLLSLSLADGLGGVLPMLEVVVGACLVVGLLARATGGLSALMQLAFIIGIASVWSRGISINCGCFGNGGSDPDAFSKYPWEMARDTGLFLLSLLVVWLRRTPFALDKLLFRQPTEDS
ncbi:MAG: MauE/DoxX family redox-associated membrane protein [Marmoricola sp.]